MPANSTRVKPAVRILLLAAIISSGCTAARKVARTSFRVLDAPANFVRQRINAEENQTTTTTTTTSSDTVTTPGRTVTIPPSTTETQRRSVARQDQTQPGPSPRSSPPTVTQRPKPSPNVTGQTQYPTAKPVPGKPGYVFSPFDLSGGYVDVTGYTPGQKVKDPYSGKIFLVP